MAIFEDHLRVVALEEGYVVYSEAGCVWPADSDLIDLSFWPALLLDQGDEPPAVAAQ